MKLLDRHSCEGTTPTIYIGHRQYPRSSGETYASRRWYAEWCFDGRHCHKALGTSNKKVAIQAAHDICRTIGDGQMPRTYRLSADQLRDLYLQQKRNENQAPKTIEKYTNGLTHFAAWCEKSKHTSAVRFNETDFWAYSRAMTEQGLTEKTRYDRLVLIKQAFKFAARQRLIPEYLLLGISMSKPVAAEQPCFTPQQVADLLKAADPHERAIYAAMAYLGLRFGEARDLQWDNLHWESGFVSVRRGGSRVNKTKNQKARRIPMHPDLKPYLQSLPKKFERVFTARPSKKHPDGGGPICERRLLVSLKRLCKRCKFEKPEQYKLHTFRHAFASMCARNNISQRYALEWMGHGSSEILNLYYTMYDDVAHQAMRSISYSPAAPPSSGSNPCPPSAT